MEILYLHTEIFCLTNKFKVVLYLKFLVVKGFLDSSYAVREAQKQKVYISQSLFFLWGLIIFEEQQSENEALFLPLSQIKSLIISVHINSNYYIKAHSFTQFTITLYSKNKYELTCIDLFLNKSSLQKRIFSALLPTSFQSSKQSTSQ